MSTPDQEILERAGLQLQVDGAVATIALHRPEKYNAMTPGMWAGLKEIGTSLPDDVHVVVLRGSGPCFSAGLDRAMLTPEGPAGEEPFTKVLEGTDEEVADRIATYQDGFTWLGRTDLVTIAAVHGYAIGAGFQLALACDLRVVADDVQFCMKEPALGLVPDLGGTKPLVDAVGYARALEMCATARFVGAEEATRIGLAAASVSKADLPGTVSDLVGAIAAHDSRAVLGTKALLQRAGANSLEEQCRAERTAQVPRLRALLAGGA